jgi:hypothetical protein
MSWFAFTSFDGRVAGLAQKVRGPPAGYAGVAVALLETPCSISEWQGLLRDHESPLSAVKALISARGGLRVYKPFTLGAMLVVSSLPVVGEA